MESLNTTWIVLRCNSAIVARLHMLQPTKRTKTTERKDVKASQEIAPKIVNAGAKARADREVGTAPTRLRIGRRVDGLDRSSKITSRRKRRHRAHKATCWRCKTPGLDR